MINCLLSLVLATASTQPVFIIKENNGLSRGGRREEEEERRRVTLDSSESAGAVNW